MLFFNLIVVIKYNCIHHNIKYEPKIALKPAITITAPYE